MDSNKTSNIDSPTPIQSQQQQQFEVANNYLNSNYHLTNNHSPVHQHAFNTLINESLPNVKYTDNDANEQHLVKNNNNDNNNTNGNTNIWNNCTDHPDYDQLNLTKILFNDRITNGTKDLLDNVDSNHDCFELSNDVIESNSIHCDDFKYKTLNGDIIRSVHPPGRGNTVNYKVIFILFCFIFLLLEFQFKIVFA